MTPEHFYELEDRYKRFQKKRYLKFSVGALVGSAILGVGVFGVLSFLPMDAAQEKNLEQNALVQNESNQSAELAAQTLLSSDDNASSNVVEDPMAFKSTVLFLDVKGLNKPQTKASQKESKEAQAKKDEPALLQQFSVKPCFEHAIVLAEFYHNEKLYQESMEWSKKAISFDVNASKSYIIYAKSQMAMGKKDEAISTLELYLKDSKSPEAQTLLNSYKGQK